jgi:hypothetical protein
VPPGGVGRRSALLWSLALRVAITLLALVSVLRVILALLALAGLTLLVLIRLFLTDAFLLVWRGLTGHCMSPERGESAARRNIGGKK